MDVFRKIVLILLAFCISSDATFARRRQSGSSGQSPSSQANPEGQDQFDKVFGFAQEKNKNLMIDFARNRGVFSKYKAAVCIFLDDTETEQLRAISWNFIKALYRKACPIIVTHALMKNILTCTSSNRHLFALKYAWSLFKSRKNDPKTYPAFSKNLPSDLAFSDKDWVIKQIGEFRYLLLPEKYLEHMGISRNVAESFKSEDGDANNYEIRCGFRINHMQTVKSADIKNLPDPKRNNDIKKPPVYEEYFLNALYNDQTQLGSLFCFESPTAWSIFINGHGCMGTDETRKIAGLSFQGYKKFLDFLDSKISCRVLINNTCFGSGVNAKLTYADDTIYSYDIILKGTGDTVTRTSAGFQGVYSPHANFKEFVNVVTQQEIDYEKAILSISDPRLNISLIRHARSSDFKPLFKNVFVIVDEVVQSKDEKIVIPTHSTVVLIELENIDKEIELKSSELQAIFMLHPKPVNSIKKITSDIDAVEVVKAFMAMDGFEEMTLKIINVSEINELKDVLIWYYPASKVVQAFYQKDGKNFYIQKPRGYVDIKKLVAQEVDEGVKKDRATAAMIEYNLKNNKLFNFNSYKHRQLFRGFAANKGDFSPESLKEKYEYGKTELHIAARDGEVEKIKIFCDLPDPDFFIKNYKGETILHVATANGRLEIVKQLLERAEKKKDVLEEQDNEGNTPLHRAAFAQDNSEEMITFMRQYKPDETIENKNGKTAAQLLVENKKNDDDFLFGEDLSETSTMNDLD
jgi:hypothetical protein